MSKGCHFVVGRLVCRLFLAAVFLVPGDVVIRDLGEQQFAEMRLQVLDVGLFDHVGLVGPRRFLERQPVGRGDRKEDGGVAVTSDAVGRFFDFAAPLPLDLDRQGLRFRAG